MKNNKAAIFLLLPVMLLQIFIPLLFVAEKENILSYGAEYKFSVQRIYAKSDTRLELTYFLPRYDEEINMQYAVFEEKQNGQCEITALSHTKPDGHSYLKSASSLGFVCPLSEYTVKNGNAEDIAKAARKIVSSVGLYSTAKVIDGKAVLTGVFLSDGTPIEDIEP